MAAVVLSVCERAVCVGADRRIYYACEHVHALRVLASLNPRRRAMFSSVN